MLSGLIFDFDGVLADSEPLHLRAFQQVLGARGIGLGESDYYDRYLGFDDAGVFRAIAQDQGRALTPASLDDLVRKKTEQFDKLVAGSHGLYPGAADCIRRWAAEAPIAVASGALRAEIDAVLGRTGLRRYFTTIVAAGETPRSKPAPDPYLRAVELLRPYSAAAGLDPQGCFVAVEDSPWGIESALAAGLRCIGVAQTYPADRLRAAHAVVATIGALDVDTVHGVCGGRPAASNRNHAGPGDGA